MTHVSEGVLQAFLDDELEPVERGAVAAHLLACPACRAELDRLRADAAVFSAALAALDVAPDLVAARRRIVPGPRVRIGPQRSIASTTRRAAVRAAVLVLLGAAAASAAVPGSPVRRFVVNVWHEATRLVVGTPERPRRPLPPPVATAPAPPPAEAPTAGVSVRPYEDRITVGLGALPANARIRVRLVDGDRATVEASGAPRAPRFRTSPGRIEMDGAARDVRIEVPRSVENAIVVVNGRPYFQKSGNAVRFLAPADTAGAEITFQLRP
ncbi:MAG: zf-HC2 domain-containing protein [Gemmatimonadetes bacterium]|nr:zf-HC2 domain-containing protein [Gemmatimonadota bacterium]